MSRLKTVYIAIFIDFNTYLQAHSHKFRDFYTQKGNVPYLFKSKTI